MASSSGKQFLAKVTFVEEMFTSYSNIATSQLVYS